MRLIAVTQLSRERAVIQRSAGSQLFGRFVEPIALEHPFGIDADVLREQPLQVSPNDR
jgi:hypothetical protein